MDSIWVIMCSGAIDTSYGWFDDERICKNMVDMLNERYKDSNLNFKAYAWSKSLYS